MGAGGPRLVSYAGRSPEVDPDAFVADGSTLVGAVRLGRDASVWYGAVIRADGAPIQVGSCSNVQDGCVLHSDPDFPVTIGDRVTVGHRAVVHGCTVEDDSLVGMGSVLLNGVVLGAGSLVAAGSVLLEGTVVPPGSLVAGVPGSVKRPVTDAERDRIRSGTESYVTRARVYRDAAGELP
jgi:carbonic anhydrase/acetyltransferase-like protein (isoleucine patch superfamily)